MLTKRQGVTEEAFGMAKKNYVRLILRTLLATLHMKISSRPPWENSGCDPAPGVSRRRDVELQGKHLVDLAEYSSLHSDAVWLRGWPRPSLSCVTVNTPFCVTGWPIVDNQLNSTFGNRHSLQPIGGIHYWLAYQQKRLDSNWTFCITLRQWAQ